MIVILYEMECNSTHGLALRIKRAMEREEMVCCLMPIHRPDYNILEKAYCIVFGCKTESLVMARFMNETQDIYKNQAWKNKAAAGFTPLFNLNSKETIQTLCNFAAQHSMIWIPQGHLAENEGHNVFYGSSSTRVNSNKSYLGCVATTDDVDLTSDCFGKRIAQQVRKLRFL